MGYRRDNVGGAAGVPQKACRLRCTAQVGSPGPKGDIAHRAKKLLGRASATTHRMKVGTGFDDYFSLLSTFRGRRSGSPRACERWSQDGRCDSHFERSQPTQLF
jgi:hypothetical protein